MGVQRDIVFVRHQHDRVALWCSRSNSAMISLPVAVSRSPVGSSASRIDGLFTSARAMATRWR